MKDTAPILIHPFPEWRDRVRAAFTTRSLGAAASGTLPSDPYAGLNLGFHCGDDPARVEGNWRRALEAEGLAGKTLAMPRMVHGDAMVDMDARRPNGFPSFSGVPGEGTVARVEPEGADALASGSSAYVLAVTMADCLTALVYDPETGTAAAVHAGWRGTRARILEKTLRALADAGRIRPESARVAFGPCLRPDSLEVGEDVAELLPEAHVFRKSGKPHFDMPGCNLMQALRAGIAPGHVRDMGGCTLSEPDRFFSYRRDGKDSGRLAAFISLV